MYGVTLPDARERDAVVVDILALTERTLTNAERIRMEEGLIHISKMAEEIQIDTKREIAKNLLMEGFDPNQVAWLTELAIEEVNTIRKQLQ